MNQPTEEDDNNEDSEPDDEEDLPVVSVASKPKPSDKGKVFTNLLGIRMCIMPRAMRMRLHAGGARGTC